MESGKLVLIPGSKCQHKVDTKKTEKHVSAYLVGTGRRSWCAKLICWLWELILLKISHCSPSMQDIAIPIKFKKEKRVLQEIMDSIIRAITSSSSVSRVLMEQYKFSYLPICFSCLLNWESEAYKVLEMWIISSEYQRPVTECDWF